MKFRLALPILSIVYGLTLGLSGCGKSQPQQSATPTTSEVSTAEPTAAQAQPQAAATDSSPAAQPDTAASDSQADSASANPSQVNDPSLSPQSARLTSRDPDATINVRSQPTTQSSAPSYGLPNDLVTLLKKAPGDDGYNWYYVKFDESEVEGWIREDFVDASGGVTASDQTTVTAHAEADSQPSCRPSDQVAFFETQNYTIDICRRDGGVQYIGAEKGTANSIVIDDVEVVEDGFVATSGDTEYIIRPNVLMVYQMSNGEYVQRSEESVIKAERF